MAVEPSKERGIWDALRGQFVAGCDQIAPRVRRRAVWARFSFKVEGGESLGNHGQRVTLAHSVVVN